MRIEVNTGGEPAEVTEEAGENGERIFVINVGRALAQDVKENGIGSQALQRGFRGMRRLPTLR